MVGRRAAVTRKHNPVRQLTPGLFPELTENPWFEGKRIPTPAFSPRTGLTTLELCAGAGGQSLGYEQAGFDHLALVELNKHACATLRANRPAWTVVEQDLATFDASPFERVDVIAGGLPCPPFSIAGKQLGIRDERNLFPVLVRLVDQVRPRAVMIENVRGILDGVFTEYRRSIAASLHKLGYQTGWNLLNASDFGVPQLRPRVVFVAIRTEYSEHFTWPARATRVKSVGAVLYDLMAANGWNGVAKWRTKANLIAPTIVGGSQKHGGPDLGPTRARQAWAALGVDGLGIAAASPDPDFVGMPRLTVPMVARLQGFPDDWDFCGGKTAAYRQVGNAFPPPVARAVAESLRDCLTASRLVQVAG